MLCLSSLRQALLSYRSDHMLLAAFLFPAGLVSGREFSDGLRQLGMHVSTGEVELLMKQLDVSGRWAPRPPPPLFLGTRVPARTLANPIAR